MNTKFDVGDELFITGKVIAVHMTNSETTYTVQIKDHDNLRFNFKEKELLLKKRIRGL